MFLAPGSQVKVASTVMPSPCSTALRRRRPGPSRPHSPAGPPPPATRRLLRSPAAGLHRSDTRPRLAGTLTDSTGLPTAARPHLRAAIRDDTCAASGSSLGRIRSSASSQRHLRAQPLARLRQFTPVGSAAHDNQTLFRQGFPVPRYALVGHPRIRRFGKAWNRRHKWRCSGADSGSFSQLIRRAHRRQRCVHPQTALDLRSRRCPHGPERVRRHRRRRYAR